MRTLLRGDGECRTTLVTLVLIVVMVGLLVSTGVAVAAPNLLMDPSCEENHQPSPHDWSGLTENTWCEEISDPSDFGTSAPDGTYIFRDIALTDGSYDYDIYQEVSVSRGSTYRVSGSYGTDFGKSSNDEAEIVIEFYAVGSPVGSDTTIGPTQSDEFWTSFSEDVTAPSDADTLRLTAHFHDNDGNTTEVYYDDFSITEINAAPTLDANAGLTVDEGSNANQISSSELSSSDLDGDLVTYDVTTAVSNGMLFVDGSGGGTDDGTLDGESAIETGSFTQTVVDNGNLLYSHDGSETTSDSFDFDVNDGNRGSVTGNTFLITVNSGNDAPTLSTDTRWLTSIGENDTASGGTTVSTVLSSAGKTSDAEGDTLGVAVTDVDDTDGTWEYSTDGGATWSTVSSASPSDASALLLVGDDDLRFVPNADFSGTAGGSVTIRAWDGTSGSAGETGVDTTSNGGTTAFSSHTAHVTITVDDAPAVSSITRSSPSSPTNADSVDYTVTFTESVSGVDTGDSSVIQVSGDASGSVSAVSGSDSSYTVTVGYVTGDGDLRLDLTDDDSITNGKGVALGGTGTSGSADGSHNGDESFTIDNTAPTLDSVSRVDDTTIDVVISDGGSGIDTGSIDQSDFSVDAGSIASIDTSSVTDGQTGAQTVTLTLDSAVDSDTVTVSLQPDGIQDKAGNGRTSGSDTATNMDGMVGAVSIASPADGSIHGSHQSISGSASDSGSGLDEVEVKIENSNGDTWDGTSFTATTTWVTASGTSSWSYDTAAHGINTDDTYTISARATDNSGNTKTTETRSYTVDTTAPSVIAVSIVDNTDGSGVVTDGDTVQVTATVIDANSISSVSADASAFDSESGGTVTLTHDSGDTYTATFTVGASPTEHDQSVTVSATDEAGNGGSQDVSSGTLNIDTSAPSVSSVIIVDETDGDGVVTDGDTVEVTTTITDVNAISSVRADASIFDGGMVPLQDDGSNSGPGDDDYSATFTVGSSPTEGRSQTLTVSATDEAGNGGSQNEASDPLAIDTTVPSASDDSGSIGEDDAATTLVADARDNDDDNVASTDNLTITEVNGDPSNVGSSVDGDNGSTFTIDARGLVTFDPDGDFESLGDGESETTSVAMTVADEAGYTDTATVTATVNGLNDAPTMSTDDRSLDSIDEDHTANGGTQVSTILGSAGTTGDDEGDTLGIAVTSVDDTDGSWEYSADGGSSWSTIDSASPAASSALLLADDDRVRFVPDPDVSGSAGGFVTIRAWDQTSGAAGDPSVDTTTNGGTTAYSVATATAGATVQDAPEVSSITRSSPSSPTSADSVEFAVTFSESVSNVDAGDFDATPVSGDVTGSVASVDSSSGITITVTVDSITGDGNLRLDLTDDDSITNGNGVPLGGVGTSGGSGDSSHTGDETFTVDNTVPSVSNVGITDATDGNGVVADGDTVKVTADVTDANSFSSVTADASAFGTGTVTLSHDSGDTYSATFTVGASATEGNQAVTVSATDEAGNGGNQAVSSGTLTVDTTNPTITSTTTRDSDNNGEIDQLEVSFSEPVSVEDGDPGDGIDGLAVSGYTIVGVDSGDGTSTITFSLMESGSADTGAPPDVAYFQSGGLADVDQPAQEVAAYGPTDGAAPAFTSVTTIDSDDNGYVDQLTVTFSESLASDSVEAADLSVGSANGLDGSTTVSSVFSDDGDDTVTVELSEGQTTYDTNATPTLTYSEDGSGGAIQDGSGNQMADQTSGAASDGAKPLISSFTVSNSSSQDVTITIETGEQLGGADGDVAVSISDAESATLSGNDFAESGSGPYTYEATYSGSSDGTYTATLDTARDAASNDGAEGESDSATVDTIDTVDAADTTVDENEPGSITVTATDDGTNAGAGFTITVITNDTLDGFADGDTNVTDSNGQVTFTFEEVTTGTYTPEFAWAENTSVADTATITVESTGSGNGGSGAGGGSSSGGSDDTEGAADRPRVVTGQPTDDGSVDFTVSDSAGTGIIVLWFDGEAEPPSNDGTDDASEPDADDAESAAEEDSQDQDSADTPSRNVDLDSLSIRPTETGTRKFDVTVRHWDADLGGTDEGADNLGDDSSSTAGSSATDEDKGDRTDPQAFREESGASAIGYLEVTHSNPEVDIENVEFQFRVRTGYLEGYGVKPEAVNLYRDETTRWNELETNLVETTDTHHVFEAESPGLSVFVIGAPGLTKPDVTQQPERASEETDDIQQPEQPSKGTDDTQQPAQASDERDSDAGLPGFGFLVAGLTVLATLALIWWRRAEGS